MKRELDELDEFKQFESIKELTDMQNGLYPQLLNFIVDFNNQSKETRNYEELSLPFYSGLQQKVIKNREIIMIVGQESRNSGSFDKTSWKNWCNKKPNADWTKSDIQTKWVNAYTEFQLTDDNRKKNEINKIFSIKNNNGPFWRFIRDLCKNNNLYPFYTNIDKVHRYVPSNNDQSSKLGDKFYSAPLTYKIEENIYDKFKDIDKYILREEIKIVNDTGKLKAIVFLVGPKYAKSIQYALGVENKQLNEKPQYKNKNNSQDKLCIISEELKEALGIDVTVFWTYHPNFLLTRGLSDSRWSGIIQKIIDEIKKDS